MSSFCCRHLHFFLQILLFFFLAEIRDPSVYAQASNNNQLALIFHGDCDEEDAKLDESRRVMKSDNGCVRTHCPRKTSRSTQHHPSFPASAVDQYEICRLEPRIDGEESIRNFKPWLEASNASGNFFGLRDRLLKQGINFGISSINEVWGNTMGGIRTGSVYTSVTQCATTLDLEKLMGWQGGSFYSRWIYLAGQDPGINLAGSLFGISAIGGNSTLRNIELWLQQNILQDTVSLRAGQIVADSEFAISDYGAVFINNTFGWPAGLYTSIPNGGPAFPIGVPGVRLKLMPNDQFSLKAALFQGNVYPQNINNHGFTWNLNSNQGYFYLTEAAYHYQCFLPGEIKTGCWLCSSRFQNFSNTNSATSDNYGIYAISDQMIYCSPDNNKRDNISQPLTKRFSKEPPPRGLGCFNRMTLEPSNNNLLHLYYDTGLNFRGLLPSRSQDIMGLALAYGLLSNDAISSTAQTQGTSLSQNTFDIEFTYQLQLTQWFTLQPDIQYVIHPGMTQTLGNALVVGLRTTIIF
jgi:porin